MTLPERDTFDCPFCGAAVRLGARVCRACGATEDCGWHDESDSEHALDDSFDYDEFISREFPDDSQAVSGSRHDGQWLVRIIILAIVVSMILTYIA